MKKGFSISLSILMLAAMLHISVATHYCGGKEFSTKLSLTGKLAHCNMEDSENEIPLHGTNLTKHCCEDIVAFCGIDNNYTPTFSFVPESYQYNFQILAIPVALSVNSYTGLTPFYTNVSPPDELSSTSVDLSDICVFRI
jgi:hypothetical protein